MAGFLFSLINLPSLSAVQIAGFDTFVNDRFTNDSSFVANQFDLSGVGLNGRWATMISENVYITAEHFSPVIGSSMTFYSGNDPAGISVTRQITSTRLQIQNTDILIGTLDSVLPAGFSFFDFATEDISTGPGSGPGSFAQSSYNNANAFVFGRSPTAWSTSQDMAVGRNVLNGFNFRIVSGANEGPSIEASDDGLSGVSSEAMLQGGDSGGPLFVENAQGRLTIVGVNWFIADTNEDAINDIFGVSYLGNHDAEIQAFIDANAVPEPSALALLLGLMSCAYLLLSRRSY